MKNLFRLVLIIVSSCLLLACEKHSLGFERVVSINEIRDYLPDAIFKSGKVVYKNQWGKEWILDIVYREYINNLSYKTEVYEAEEFRITLVDTSVNFSIVLQGGANYTDGGLVKTLICYLMPFNESGSLIFNIFFPLSVKKQRSSNFASLISINNKEYKDVYFAKSSSSQFYSQMFINRNEGVVAFEDRFNEIWTFDRYIE
ncbi:MAG: hypothetical protein IPM34_08380 [Saprospiraceae bacterium]|nr:hypothetical protein [Saprospiraceae bacterium]